MIKTFPHAVIVNGKFVRANTPVEVKEKAEKKVEPVVAENATVEKVDVAEDATTKPKRKGGKKNDKAGDREA